MDQSTIQPRSRTSRRARPSLAAFTDSGYEPSRPIPATYPKKIKVHRPPQSHNTSALSVSDEPPHWGIPEPSIASPQLQPSHALGDLFTTDSYRASTFRGSKSHTMRHKRSSYFDGEASGTIRLDGASKSGSSGYNHRTSTISRSATISSAWSGVSNRLFMESILGTGNEREANEFTYQFDKLAKKHGVRPFPHDLNANPTSVSVSSASHHYSSGESAPSTIRGSRLWNKLLGRTPNTIDVSKLHGNMKMTLTKRRNVDVSDLAAIGKGKRDSLKGMHLEDMIRLGGVAIFNLPLGLAPGDLLIPTCIHAAASFLLNNGLRTPGIFRVSGNLTTVYSLYDHYQRQLEENNNGSVVATTALARLPTHIHYSIHDVAHLFRKLLHGLPGGLLGSPAVFQALYNVHRFVYPDPTLRDHMTQKVKPRMIALALSSINLHFRISLVCAVFGLLRAITLASEQEVETKVKDPHELFAQMKEDALGIVFGPLLLGDKSDHILTEDLEDRGGLLVLATVEATKSSTRYSKKKAEMGYNKRQLEKTRRAAMVCQMLIDNWEDIAYQMKRINTLGATAQAYDLPAQVQPQSELKYMYEEPKKSSLRGESSYRARSERGVARSSTRRSNRTPVAEEPEEEYQYPFQPRHHGHRKPMPSFNGHLYPEPEEEEDDAPNLIVFPSDGEEEPEVPVSGPYVAERVINREITPVFEMTPIRALKPPAPPQFQGTSPNWRVITPGGEASVPSTPIPRFEGNWGSELGQSPEPNWRQTSGQDSEPNWRQTSTQDSEPNWRQASAQDSEPNWRQASSQESEPNWCEATPDQSPEQFRDPSKNQRYRDQSMDQSAQRFRDSVMDQPSQRFRNPSIDDTPQRRTSDGQRVVSQVSIDARRSISLGSRGNIELFGPGTPPLDMTPQAAIRPRRDPLSLAPAFEEHSPTPSVNGRNTESRNSIRIEPVERRTTFGRRPISPVPELSPPQVPPVTEHDEDEDDEDHRPITPRPLSYRKKSRTSSFSIFEDQESDRERTPRDDDFRFPSSPVLTLTKPNSRGEIKLNLKGTKPAPSRQVSDSQRSETVPLQPATANRRPREVSLEADFEDKYLFENEDGESQKKLRGNSALYAEIRRLQRLVDQKNEEAIQTKRELELAKSMANAGTLSQLVRETQEQLKVWKNRAEWAEKQLRERGMAMAARASNGGGSFRGHAHRASMS